MGWLLPSGNQFIWVKPQFYVIRDSSDKISPPDKSARPDPSSWFSVAYDKQNKFWIARHNPEVCKRFMKGAVTGSAGPGDVDQDLWLMGRSTDPVLVLKDYQYITESVPVKSGNAFRGGMYGSGNSDSPNEYMQRTTFVRQLDSAAMTPQERLCEMTQMAVEDPQFSQQMKAQFGALGDPMVLLQLGAIIGVFIGIGAGAAVLGGAAFAAGLMRLLGLGMLTHQVSGYVTQFNIVQKAVSSDKQADFVKGTQAVQAILLMAMTDIAMFVTMEGALKAGSKACGVLKSLILKYAPEEWIAAAKKMKGEAEHAAAKARAKVQGYAQLQLMKRVNDIGKLFRKAEVDYFLDRSAKNKEMIVIRGPSETRMQWLTKLNGWLDGKSEWIKAKSWMGWSIGGKPLGLVGVPKGALDTAMSQAGKRLKATHSYDMGQLKGVFKEIDDFIAKHPTAKAYEIPYGVKLELEVPGKGKMKVFDWEAARHNHADAQGYRLVDVGDSYLIVDSLGRPVCQDLDIGAVQKLGTPAGAIPGSHVQAGRVNPEDNFMIQEMANWKMARDSGQPYSPYKHSASGSGRHIGETEAEAARLRAAGKHEEAAKKKPWKPRNADGSYDGEELYVILPTAGGGSEMFYCKGWADLEKFWKANQSLFGSEWVY